MANEIVTDRVKDILASKPVTFKLRTEHTIPRDTLYYQPLTIELSAPAASLRGRPVKAQIRVYDVGVVSIAVRAACQGASLGELLPLHRPQLDGGQPLGEWARKLCHDVCKSLEDVLVQPVPPSDPEAYTVFCLNDLDGPNDANRWLADHRREVAQLLTESHDGWLSEMQVGEVLRISRSYASTDLVVIDWDAALVVDLSGYVDDVLYVLELANLQLEEYRMMDPRLDKYLERAYDDLKRRLGPFGTPSQKLRALRLFRVDVTKLNDEVTHISKFVGDWYLAKVYLGASERFYLNQWRQSVQERLGELDRLYNVVNTDITNRRMVWLEIIVVIFFAIDLVLIVLQMR